MHERHWQLILSFVLILIYVSMYSGPMEWCAGRCSVWEVPLILESLIMTFLSTLEVGRD